MQLFKLWPPYSASLTSAFHRCFVPNTLSTSVPHFVKQLTAPQVLTFAVGRLQGIAQLAPAARGQLQCYELALQQLQSIKNILSGFNSFVSYQCHAQSEFTQTK